MKKLKSVLCLALFLVFGAVMFVGCGPKNETPKNQTTITLAESKEIIVNALALDDTQVMAMEDVLQEGNRDLLEKFGKFSVNASENLHTTMDVRPGDQFASMALSYVNINGNYIYENNDFVKYLTDIEIGVLGERRYVSSKEYLSDKTLYSFYDKYEIEPGQYVDNKVISQEYQDMRGFGYGDTLGQVLIQLIDGLFTDKAFDSVYESDVIKTTNEDSYTLTLKLDLKGYHRLLTLN